MWPGTIVNWHDLSEIGRENPVDNLDDSPLLFQVFGADKGTEDFVVISGTDFKAMYGTSSFDKYGQSSIQAQAIIDAGGRLFAKRVVATDSLLANFVILATVTTQSDGSAKITLSKHVIQNAKKFSEVKDAAMALLDDANGVYPIVIVADNGRGVSSKAIRISPDYNTSKTIGAMFYTMITYEGNKIIEQNAITADPTVVYNNTAYRLDQYVGVQTKAEIPETVFEMLVAKVSSIVGVPVDRVRNYDLLYGYNFNGNRLTNVVVDGIDLDVENGVELEGGSNGNFGDAPMATPTGKAAMMEEIRKVFAGEVSDIVYDIDTYKIAAIVDANYSDEVKNAIADLVMFREDCMFFRDYGLGITTYIELEARHNDFANRRSKFISDYFTTYMVKDPNTFKNIEVTMTYDLAPVIVRHIANGPYNPLAGIVNGFVLANAIKGTLNFSPIITPSVNQKKAVDDIRANYAIFQGNDCIVQSEYTSQERWTQLSYANNVMAIQQVVRAVRTACPRKRYSLSTSKNLASYADHVNNVLSKFVTNFDVLRFIYTQDKLKESQKIFYASIEFAFLYWGQTEIFDIYAINNEE